MGLRDYLTRAWRRSFAAEVALPYTPTTRRVSTTMGPRDDVVTAAAVDVGEYTGKQQYATGDQGWQDELWRFFEELGEFAFVVNWKGNTASRVRLRAGKIETGADEPTIETDGVAADLVDKLGGGTGGQSGLLADLMIQMSVPAEGWLVGETRDGVEYWCVKSNAEIRRGRARGTVRAAAYEVIDEYSPPGTNEWRQLDPNSLVVRVWRPHPRRHNEAYSPARSARTTMHELELINRKIVAQYLSRLASAGLLLLPDELEFPVRPEFLDAANPFFRELVEVASEAIKTPGSAAATVPIPLTGPAELIDKVRHLDMTIKLDDKEIEKRDSVLRRLATQLDVPGEILTGMGGINHWGAWAIDEQAFKAHVAPDVELICSALTVGYLRPRLAAMGEDPAEWAVWYDASEVVQRPDKSQHADVAYKSLEISPEAYRRELGFDEGDAPTELELQAMVLKRLAVDPQLGLELVEYVQDIPGFLAAQDEKEQKADERADKMLDNLDGAPPNPDDQIDQNGPPNTQDAPPPPSDGGRPAPQAAQAISDAYLARLVDQAGLQHAITYSAVGPPVLMHPKACREHLPSCPFTHSFARRSPPFRPGTSGTYECRLTKEGLLALGPRIMSSLDEFMSYTPNIIHFNGRRNGTPVRG
jgi:hypothetical protein